MKKNAYTSRSGPGYRSARLSAKRQNRRRRLFMFFLVAGAMAAVIAFAAVFLAVRASSSSGGSVAPAAAATEESGSGNVILTARDESGRLNQLAVLVPEAGGGYSFYTIPPRTIAEVPGHGFQQFADLPGAGALTPEAQALLDQTVANLLQLPIQYHVNLDYPALEAAVTEAGTVDFKSNRPLTIATTGGEAVNLSAGDNPASAERSLGYLQAAAAHPKAGPAVQALFYQGLQSSFSLKSEADRRALAHKLYQKVETNMDEDALTNLFAAATAPGSGFGVWALPVRQAGNGAGWYLEPVPAEIAALLSGTAADAATLLEIHNGAEASGVVEAAAQRLAPLRYTTTLQADPSGVNFDVTQIRAGSDALAAAGRVRDILGKGTIIKDDSMEKNQIIVIIGRDMTLAELEKR